MKEGLTARIKRIITGGAHAIIDAVEDLAPDAVMEQAIREVESAIDEVRAELGRNAASKHLATSRLMEENKRHEDLAAQIEVAVREKRDDLAEAAIARQLDIEAQIPVLESAIADAAGQEKELEGYIAALQAKRREMVEELRRFRQAQAQAGAANLAGKPGLAGIAKVESEVDKAQGAFDRVIDRQTGLPGLTGAPDRKSAQQLLELETLARQNRVQERLAALKAKAPNK